MQHCPACGPSAVLAGLALPQGPSMGPAGTSEWDKATPGNQRSPVSWWGQGHWLCSDGSVAGSGPQGNGVWPLHWVFSWDFPKSLTPEQD